MSLNFQTNWQNYNSRRLSKPVGVQLAHLSALKNMAAFLRYLLLANLKQVGLNIKFRFKKKSNFEKISINSSQRTRVEQFSNSFLSSEIIIITLQLTIWTKFQKN